MNVNMFAYTHENVYVHTPPLSSAAATESARSATGTMHKSL